MSLSPRKHQFVLREHLVTQVTGGALARDDGYFVASGVTRFVELGTGKVLSGLAKRAAADAQNHNLDTLDDIQVGHGEGVLPMFDLTGKQPATGASGGIGS